MSISTSICKLTTLLNFPLQFWAKKFSVLPDIDPTRRTFMNSSIANVSGNFSEKSPVHQFTAESVTISTLRRSFFTLFAQLPSALFAFYTTVVTNGFVCLLTANSALP